MSKIAVLVEFNFMTRIVIDKNEENIETIVSKCRPKILRKVEEELAENLCEWYEDTEMPYEEDSVDHCVNQEVED